MTNEVTTAEIRKLAAVKLKTDLKYLVARYEQEASDATTNPNPYHPANSEWRVLLASAFTLERMIDELKTKTVADGLQTIMP